MTEQSCVDNAAQKMSPGDVLQAKTSLPLMPFSNQFLAMFSLLEIRVWATTRTQAQTLVLEHKVTTSQSSNQLLSLEQALYQTKSWCQIYCDPDCAPLLLRKS